MDNTTNDERASIAAMQSHGGNACPLGHVFSLKAKKTTLT